MMENIKTLSVIQKVYPVRLNMNDLMQKLSYNNIDKLQVDVMSSNYNNNLIFKDKSGIFYETPLDELVRLACGRFVEEYTTDFKLLANSVDKWKHLEEKKLDPRHTYRFKVDGRYDVPGTMGEKTRSISGVCYINITHGNIFDEDGKFLRLR